MPYAFIKPLKDNGLINVLTWMMLKKSAALCSAWRATGADVTVSVNLSLKSLADPQLADRVILKIDQSFVMNAARQESPRVILESSLGMAKKLNITAVAEGVETQENWNWLRDLGCGLAQGYFIARPMEIGAYRDWVRDWKQPDARS